MSYNANLFGQFILLFKALKKAAHDDPKRFVVFHDESQPLRRARQDFENFMLRTDFEQRVMHGEKKYFPQVPPTFEAEWKDYQELWSGALAHVFLKEIGFEVGDYDSKVKPNRTLEAPDAEHDVDFNPAFHKGGDALDMAFWPTRNYADEIGRDFEDDIHRASRIGLQAYEYLQRTIGLQLSDVFRRWQMLPVIFMPSHVSNKHGSSEKGSLYDLLDNAIRAFVADAPAASIAMCKAALEMVLKQHYNLPYQFVDKEGQRRDKGLAELIVLADEKYDFVQSNKILPLKNKADKIMHSYSRARKLPEEDEQTILQFLKTVKFLIQRAPA